MKTCNLPRHIMCVLLLIIASNAFASTLCNQLLIKDTTSNNIKKEIQSNINAMMRFAIAHTRLIASRCAISGCLINYFIINIANLLIYDRKVAAAIDLHKSNKNLSLVDN